MWGFKNVKWIKIRVSLNKLVFGLFLNNHVFDACDNPDEADADVPEVDVTATRHREPFASLAVSMLDKPGPRTKNVARLGFPW